VIVRASIVLLVGVAIQTARTRGIRVKEFLRFYVVWGAILSCVIPLAFLLAAIAHGQARWPFR
jgi:hypothetical protein